MTSSKTERNIFSSAAAFIKREPVLVISALCAAVSMIFVPPSADYLSYIDFKVLALLFSLMAVVAGFARCGLFDVMAFGLLSRCGDIRALRAALVLLPFFTAMFITNDVALITFVPFAISVLGMTGRSDQLIPVVALQTAAANLGSMATPVGNPQSLFIYNHFSLSSSQYFGTLLPYVLLSLAVLFAASLCTKKSSISVNFGKKLKIQKPKMLLLFSLLFALCMACVLRVLDYRIMLVVVAAAMLIFDRRLFSCVDYGLLLTFVCFFIFSGNLGNIPAVRGFLSDMLGKSPFFTSLCASQVISNVPAAVLLSGFTDDWRGMLLGTNIGGLGTVIASLASLISFKFYNGCKEAKPLRYLAAFTAVCLVGLALLTGLYFIL